VLSTLPKNRDSRFLHVENMETPVVVDGHIDREGE
jgi:hypothetical protein